MHNQEEIDVIEINLILHAIKYRYGMDFFNYDLRLVKKRIDDFKARYQIDSFSALLDSILNDKAIGMALISYFCICVSTLFRDPDIFQMIKQDIIPYLDTEPIIRVWIAGCASGEEAYSTAIWLEEAGLYHKSIIYATDISEQSLHLAEKGIYPIDKLNDFQSNYLKAGGASALSEYYSQQYNYFCFKSSLKKNIVFSKHNLVSDGLFNEFSIIFCRNVMIYFDENLRVQVFDKFYQSLKPLGFLILGKSEWMPDSILFKYKLAQIGHRSIYKKIDRTSQMRLINERR